MIRLNNWTLVHFTQGLHYKDRQKAKRKLLSLCARDMVYILRCCLKQSSKTKV